MAKRKHKGGIKKTTVMENGKFIKYVLWPCLIVIVASLGFLIWYINRQNSTYEHILYIRSFMTSSGKLNDFQNKLGMHDPETDIKWYMDKDNIEIDFGYIILTWEKEDFFQEDNLTLLSTIGFTTEITETKDKKSKTLHLYYMGEELERWIR